MKKNTFFLQPGCVFALFPLLEETKEGTKKVRRQKRTDTVNR